MWIGGNVIPATAYQESPVWIPGGSPPSGIAFISNISAASTDSNGITTSSINTTGANFIVMAVASYQVMSAPTPTDSKSNTWIGLTEATLPANGRIQIWYSDVPAITGTGHTFTVPGTGNYPAICVAAFSGVKTSPFDQQNQSSDTLVSSIQAGSITPGQDGELIIAAAQYNATPGAAIDSGFTKTDSQDSITFNFGCALAYLIQGTAAPVNPTWSIANQLCAAIASFKPA